MLKINLRNWCISLVFIIRNKEIFSRYCRSRLCRRNNACLTELCSEISGLQFTSLAAKVMISECPSRAVMDGGKSLNNRNFILKCMEKYAQRKILFRDTKWLLSNMSYRGRDDRAV